MIQQLDDRCRQGAFRKRRQMKTICMKCAWHSNAESRRVKQRCYAPWPKQIDPVTGKQKPEYVECDGKNDGNCVHFKPLWYVRLWNYINKHFVYPSS